METDIEFNKVFKQPVFTIEDLERDEDIEILQHNSQDWIIFKEVIKIYVKIRQYSTNKIFWFYYIVGDNFIIFPTLIKEQKQKPEL